MSPVHQNVLVISDEEGDTLIIERIGETLWLTVATTSGTSYLEFTKLSDIRAITEYLQKNWGI